MAETASFAGRAAALVALLAVACGNGSGHGADAGADAGDGGAQDSGADADVDGGVDAGDTDSASEGDGGTPACAEAGGTCVHTALADPPCPDGTRWDLFDMQLGCAGAADQVTCCAPFAGDCTFHGGSSMGIDKDPFTCEAAGVCISGVQGDSCAYAADISDGFGGGPWNADVTVTALAGNALEIAGVHHDTGRTFTCSGLAADDYGLVPRVWECEACDAADDCAACSVTHSGLCQF
jgi:hypothetical protein